MPATIAHTGYLSAHVITRRYGITYARLLTLVSSQAVGVLNSPGLMPQYSEDDLQGVLAKDSRRTKRTRTA